MGGIVSVGKGSMNPPQLLSVAYTGDPESRDVLAVVGKGITYDSGGLSLKTRAGQLNMKSDMAGAATALGIIRALMLLNIRSMFWRLCLWPKIFLQECLIM